MFLSIATTHRPATDLGFLLHKHPERVHETELPFGKAIVFYPQAEGARCEAALVLDIDPIGLVRGRGRSEGLLDAYVNDRPYAASSFLSVAMGRALRTAMTGSSRERPDLAVTEIPLEVIVTPLPARGGVRLVHELFEPLGWSVETEAVADGGALTGKTPTYVKLKLAGKARLQSLLNHLYVLIPVMDDDKHYWVGYDEVEKLLKRGEGWLDNHPARDLIVRRYLSHRRALARNALERLAPDTGDEPTESEKRVTPEAAIEAPMSLNDRRLDAVVETLRASGARAIADLGCGEGKLLQRLVRERWVERLVGVDAAARDLEWASKRLKLDVAGAPPDGRVTLLHGGITYRDKRWENVDAVALVEVIEHLDAERLPTLEKIVFSAARPATVVVTTPNSEYNALFSNLAAGAFRHPDHRFEWTRAQFEGWASGVAEAHGYEVTFGSIGSIDDTHGAPTQMGIFTKGSAA
jgi:3' terminal RNA ribose 2'-O-methyltransferase Hen1